MNPSSGSSGRSCILDPPVRWQPLAAMFVIIPDRAGIVKATSGHSAIKKTHRSQPFGQPRRVTIEQCACLEGMSRKDPIAPRERLP